MRSMNVLMWIFVLAFFVSAKGKVRYDLEKLFNDTKVTILHRSVTVVSSDGKQSLVGSEEPDEGLVWMNGVSFSQLRIRTQFNG